MTAAAWADLTRALQVVASACEGDDRFTDDATEHDADLREVCASCPVLAECRSYSTHTRGHQIAGFWTGYRRGALSREAAAS